MRTGTAILTDNKKVLTEQIIQGNKTDFIQIDVMDGKFVPGKSVWSKEVNEAMKKAKVPVELHLMIEDVDTLIDDFLQTKAKTIIFHYEATQNHEEIVKKIRSAKKKAGIAIKLQTSATVLRKLLPILDLVLVYCTEKIGEQGPPFSILATKNISIIREYDKKIPIEADGGIKPSTARLCRLAGATQCVSGSYLSSNNFSEEALRQLRDA